MTESPRERDVADGLRRMFLEDLKGGGAAHDTFGQIAVNGRLVTATQLQAALAEQASKGGRIGDILRRQGALDIRGLLTVLRAQRVMRKIPIITVGRYFLVEKIGEGATGVVIRAIHEDLCKLVAIKILSERPDLPRNMLDRFRREATTAARLQHPNIVGVHDVGVDGDQHYIAMDLIEGVTLGTWLKDASRHVGDRLRILEKVARAVDHAHREGVLHRDLKPENVLVRENGEPVLVDFGLARGLTDTKLTQEGAVMGTPVYMAPEQVRGDVGAIGPRTDVYALGVMVFEAVTGEVPFDGRTPAEVYERILRSDAPAPSERKRGLPRELDAITGKCLEKEPGARYESAGALADDLHRLATGEPVAATRMGTARKLWRRVKRRPGAVAAVVAALVLAGVGAWAVTQWQRGQELHAGAAYALKLQSAYLSLSPAVAPLLAEAETVRYRGGDAARVVAAVDGATADETGVGESMRAWARFLVRDASWEKRLAEARTRYPDNPLLALTEARCRLRAYIDDVTWPSEGMRFHPAPGDTGALRPETTPAMAARLAEARRSLEAARAMPAWSLMPELAWITELCGGFEDFTATDYPGALKRLRPLVGREDAGTEATLLACYAMSPDVDGIIELARALVARRPQLTPASEMLVAGLHYRAHRDLLVRKDCLKDLEEARRIARRISARPEADARVGMLHLWMAQARVILGTDAREDAAAAVAILNRVIEDHPRNLRARVNRAAALVISGKSEAVDAAFADLEEAVRIDPSSVTARLNLAILLCKRIHAVVLSGGEPAVALAAARENFDRLRDLPCDAGDLLETEAMLAFEEGEAARVQSRSSAPSYERAEAAARRLETARPGNPRARYLALMSALRLAELRGVTAEDLRRLTRGLDALAGEPEYRPVRQDAATMCDVFSRRTGAGAGLHEAAIEAWDIAIREKPLPASYARRAAAKSRLSSQAPARAKELLADAVADFEKAIPEGSEAHDAHEGIADVLIRLMALGGTGSWTMNACRERAAKELDRAIGLKGTCPAARSLRMRLRLTEGDAAGAREDLDALRGVPASLEAAEQPLRAALRTVDQALARNPADGTALKLRAQLLVVLRDRRATGAVAALKDVDEAEARRLQALIEE